MSARADGELEREAVLADDAADGGTEGAERGAEYGTDWVRPVATSARIVFCHTLPFTVE